MTSLGGIDPGHFPVCALRQYRTGTGTSVDAVLVSGDCETSLGTFHVWRDC